MVLIYGMNLLPDGPYDSDHMDNRASYSDSLLVDGPSYLVVFSFNCSCPDLLIYLLWMHKHSMMVYILI